MAQMFVLFQFLPTELRLKIWNYACRFFPRIIEVRPQLLNNNIPVEYRQWDAITNATIPLLQVNREARYELLPRYSAPFSLLRICSPYPASLLISYEIDTLYFRVSVESHMPKEKLFEYVFDGAETEVKDNLRSLAGNSTFWKNVFPTRDVDPALEFLQFERFTKLEEVIVVPTVEQLLDGPNGRPRLETFEECEARSPYEARYGPWFSKGFNLTPRRVPRSIKLCKEVGKLELGSAL